MSTVENIGRNEQEALQRFADTRRQESDESEIIEPASKHLQRSAIYISILCLLIGLITVCLGKLDVIVTARGAIEPRTKLVPVQSRNAGVIRDVVVNVGDTVKPGQLLMRLKTETSDVDIASLDRQLSLLMREKDGKNGEAQMLEAAIADFAALNGDDFDLAKANASVELLQAVRIAQLSTDRNARVAGQDLEKLVAQTGYRIDAINKTIAIRRDNLGIASDVIGDLDASRNLRSQQLASVKDLVQKGISTKTRELEVSDQVLSRVGSVNDQREKIGELKLSIASDELKIADLNLEIATETRKRKDALYEAEKTLSGAKATVIARFAKLKAEIDTLTADIDKRGSDLVLRKDRAQQLEIRAPVAGTIASLTIASAGVRVEDGTEVARLVPDGVSNVVTANLQSRDVGEVRTGQRAVIKLDAFPFYRFGTVSAHVAAIFPRPGSKLFGVRLELDRPTIDAGGRQEPIAVGLETTVEIMTERRRIIGILFDHGARAFSKTPVDKTLGIDDPEPPEKQAFAQ